MILDHHRTFPDRQDAHPYDRGTTRDRFLNAWLTVVRRYANHQHVVGINAYNEYSGTDANFLVAYTQDVFTTVEQEFPNRFLYYCTGVLWSGKLVGVSVDYLPFHDRIYYSLHKYVFSIGQGENYEQSWEESLGGHQPEKVVIGEWGFLNEDQWWGDRFTTWLLQKGTRDNVFLDYCKERRHWGTVGRRLHYV